MKESGDRRPKTEGTRTFQVRDSEKSGFNNN